MNKLLLSLGIIIGGLLVGYLIQRLVARQWLTLPVSLATLRKSLQKSALLIIFPVTIAGALWVTRIGSAAIVSLPLLGISAIMLGGGLALVAAKLMRLPRHQTGALYPCGSFTNIGSIGALICYIYLGEKGFALVPIYKLFEEITYYGVGFPIAKYFSLTGVGERESGWARIRNLARDPFILAAVSSMILGAVLNISEVPRPEVFNRINAIFIPLGTAMLLVSIGLSMRFTRVKRYLKPCLAVSAIKFAAVPLVVSTMAYLLGYGMIDNGLPLKVVVILSSMPVAFNALIPPSIYDLDLDLANACWFFTTANLVWVLPVLLAVTSSL